MWYVFKNNTCIATCDLEPNHKDLQTRDEHAIESDNIGDDVSNIVLVNDVITKKQPVPPTTLELTDSIRAKRNQLLSECDWTQLEDSPLSVSQKQAWAIYRQTLRDFPETCDPYNPIWPIKPQ